MKENLRKRLRIRVLNLALKHLFKAVTLEDVIVIKNGITYLDGKQLTKGDIVSLRSDAELLEESELYNLMKKHLRHQAHKKIYNDSVTTEDIVFGKAMLYNLSLMSNFLKKFK